MQFASFSTYKYPLQSSWILDDGSDTHVCNKLMIHRFRKTRDATEEKGLIAGDAGLRIEAYGEIYIFIDAPKDSPMTVSGKWKVILTNVYYIPNFMSNLVAARLLRLKKVFFDDINLRLHYEGKTLGLVKHLHFHDVLEDNTPPRFKGTAPSTATSFSAFKTASTNDWHQLLAHAANEAIQHLESAAEGVKISDKNSAIAPKTYECETGALSKMHHIISRSPDKSEISIKSFHNYLWSHSDDQGSERPRMGLSYRLLHLWLQPSLYA